MSPLMAILLAEQHHRELLADRARTPGHRRRLTTDGRESRRGVRDVGGLLVDHHRTTTGFE